MVMVTYLLFVVGIYLLIEGAGWIVDSSSSIAKKLGVSSLIIGLTVVAFGTSLPELLVGIFSALRGVSEVSLGNIVGSNIANILLILGITAMIGSVKIKSETVWKQIPFALLAAFVLFALSSGALSGKAVFLSISDGLILLSLFAIFIYYIFQTAKKDKKKVSLSREINTTNWKIVLKLVAGLVGIYFGGRWVVDGAVFIAGQLGLSEYLISATIIAIGTSLPELVVCIMAVLKKNIDLAVGNVIGSNIFNILWVLGIVPFVGVLSIPSFVVFDIAIMFLATVLLFAFMFIGEKHGLTRRDGIIFVSIYVLYIVFLIIRG